MCAGDLTRREVRGRFGGILVSMGIRERNHVTVAGDASARPLVFAHGFGCDQNMWRFVEPSFRDGYLTVLFDYVGAGHSDLKAFDPERYGTLAGYARDVVEICDDYAEWLAAAPGIPKLFFNVEPGAILIGAQREFCRTWPDQTEVTVAGSHFVQEDSASEIGRVIADWLTRIR